MALVIYRNCYSKWQAVFNFKQNPDNKNKKPPTYNPDKPNENREYMTSFSSERVGQSKFGGWNESGRKHFFRNAKTIHNNRIAHKARFAEVEKACYLRLQAKNKELHGKPEKPVKKRKSNEVDDDDDEAMDFMEV
jgi:hypothetical protein